MSGQVPVELRRARAAELREIARVKTEAFALGFVGKEVDVVFHARAATNAETATRWRGVSGEYLEVECAGVGSSNRQLHRVQVQGAVAGRALGIVVE
jgi:tRNA A37 methylthiotransferase MiaB